MTSMVERMARALIDDDAKEYGMDADDIAVSCWHDYIRSAIAALRGMREPPHEFLSAGEGELINGAPLSEAIRAAIDAEIATYEGEE